MSEYSIKELNEALDGVKVLSVEIKQIIKGGIGLEDLQHLVDLAKKYDVLEAAFSGLSEVPKEIKDLDESEAAQLLSKVFQILNAVKNA